MISLASLPRDEAARLRGLLFDLDDTFLSHGVLTREAYGALWDLHDAGLRLVAVTGRPSGWGEVVVRQWPIDAAVTENGAIVVVREGRGVGLRDSCSAEERRRRRARLAALIDEARAAVPRAQLADDVAARTSDATWDVGERQALPEPDVARLMELIVAGGARTLRSSVHVHASFDATDKAQGVLRFLGEAFGEDAGAARGRYAFVGDSANDAACFAAFRTTVGVANVRGYVGKMSVPPRYIAAGAMGAGFAELARVMLAAR